MNMHVDPTHATTPEVSDLTFELVAEHRAAYLNACEPADAATKASRAADETAALSLLLGTAPASREGLAAWLDYLMRHAAQTPFHLHMSTVTFQLFLAGVWTAVERQIGPAMPSAPEQVGATKTPESWRDPATMAAAGALMFEPWDDRVPRFPNDAMMQEFAENVAIANALLYRTKADLMRLITELSDQHRCGLLDAVQRAHGMSKLLVEMTESAEARVLCAGAAVACRGDATAAAA